MHGKETLPLGLEPLQKLGVDFILLSCTLGLVVLDLYEGESIVLADSLASVKGPDAVIGGEIRFVLVHQAELIGIRVF